MKKLGWPDNSWKSVLNSLDLRLLSCAITPIAYRWHNGRSP